MTPSVCTLAFGRSDHLANMVRGLAVSEVVPTELIIAVMQAEPYDLPPAPFPVRQIMLGSSGIPLAAARNRAAAEASGDLLIFLDVDCIPNPSLIGDYLHGADIKRGVLMGEVTYLPSDAQTDTLDFSQFDFSGQKHSERAGPPQERVGACRDYRCFWSLNFAISAVDFVKTGGFDEAFVGYGGEDTDFGRTLTEYDIELWWVRGAKAYHQYHPHHMPPVHHLDSVLANAQVFLDKWGEPTMQHWLRAFVLMGLIKRDGAGWVKMRDPSEADLALTRQHSDEPYASSATVLAVLEAEVTAKAPEGAIAAA